MKAQRGNCNRERYPESIQLFLVFSVSFAASSSLQSDASRKIARLLHSDILASFTPRPPLSPPFHPSHLALRHPPSLPRPCCKRNVARKITEISPRSYVSRLHIIRAIFQAGKAWSFRQVRNVVDICSSLKKRRTIKGYA